MYDIYIYMEHFRQEYQINQPEKIAVNLLMGLE